MGYAQYFLNNYREALDYFSKARELNPEDEYTLSIIRQCNMHLPLTRRVKEFWNWFVENEEKLSGMMNPKSMEEADAFMEFISKGTNLISEDMHFNIEVTMSSRSRSKDGRISSHLSLHHILYAGVSERQMEVLPLQPGQGRVFRIPCTRYRCRYGQDMVKASYDEKRENFNIRYYDKNLCALPEENRTETFMSFWNLYWEKVSHSNMSMV